MNELVIGAELDERRRWILCTCLLGKPRTPSMKKAPLVFDVRHLKQVMRTTE